MFKSEKPLKYLGMEERVSKVGNKFKMVTLFDTESYEKLEFFVGDGFEVIGGGDMMNVYLKAEKRGYNINFSCVKLESIAK